MHIHAACTDYVVYGHNDVQTYQQWVGSAHEVYDNWTFLA